MVNKPRIRQDFDIPYGKMIGYGVIRSSGELVEMKNVRVVLKYETYNGMPYYLLTAFPIL
jgi:hypothetical protein